MYPRIDGNEGDAKIIQLLAQQVSELVSLHQKFDSALSSVCTHRYNGRFARLKSRVKSLLQDQLLLPLGR